MYRKLGLRLALSCIAIGTVERSPADELKGAAQVLAEAAEAASQPRGSDEDSSDFAQRLRELDEAAATLTPEEAAARWFALLEEALNSRSHSRDVHGFVDPLGFEDFAVYEWMDQQNIQHPIGTALRHLPPPPTWNALVRVLQEQPVAGEGDDHFVQDAGLAILAKALEGDVEGQLRAAEQLLDKLPEDVSNRRRRAAERLLTQLLQYVHDPQLARQQLDRQIKAALEGDGYGLTVPDLVAMLDEEEAREWLRNVLVLPIGQIHFSSQRTQKLAKQVAIEAVEEMAAPRWSLVDDVSQESMTLFEKFRDRFLPDKPAADAPGGGLFGGFFNRWAAQPVDSMADWEYQQARAIYLVALIVHERQVEALDIVKDVAKDARQAWDGNFLAFTSLGQGGYDRQLADFLHRLLQEDPTQPVWNMYFQAAARAGRSDEAVVVAELALERQDLSAQEKVNIRKFLASALLADDQIDAGVAALRDSIRLAEAEFRWQDAKEAAGKLAEIGRLLGNNDLVDQGLQLLAKASGKPTDEQRWYASSVDPHVRLLQKLGRYVEAEAAVAAKLKQALSDRNSGGYFTGQYLMLLAQLYADAGRYEDVMTLVDQAPYWSVGDLSQLVATAQSAASRLPPPSYEARPSTSFAAVVARAMKETGRKDTALKLVKYALQTNPGEDDLYQLLVETSGQDAMEYLDELYEQDRFQERPLIWKAELLRQAGKLDRAEETAKAAIAIDPSDGEQGKGDRMRVYAVLADIHRDRGDAAQEEFLRGVVAAIRISEDADDLYRAGLLKRAIGMYREALDRFADAYCIQSRLAVQLSSIGLDAEAAEHYRRAYELMPDSFGRMESHCFGCEGAFAGAGAQQIAEEVFTRMVAERPESPQVHYMLGYLRMQQDRRQEALDLFLAAVERDPDYINAWKQIVSLGDHVQLPLEQRNQAALNLLRLDPQGKHTGSTWQQVSDLRALWNAYEAVIRQRMAPIDFSYPLPGVTRSSPEATGGYGGYYGYGQAHRPSEIARPAAAIAQQKVIAALQLLLMPAPEE